MKKFGMACALACLSVPVLADGFYVAGDVGSVKWDVEDISTTRTAWGVAAGYEFSLAFKDTMAIELGYRHLGTLNDGDNFFKYRSEFSTPQISVISTHHFTPQLAAYGRIGVARLEIDWRSTSPSGQVQTSSTAKNRAVFGIGGRYQLNDNFSTHIEYTYLRWDEITLSGPAVGVKYSF